ncbi:MAG: hypothetical protein A2201_01130 [Alicyclobacillus sp. RIFOXYA1_FULL_53_8]|nr:MAG: hypothetical protein A2201_01130 [Alicyclobacillus sp. RIFOXYA1_FULL_53_8]
MLRDLLNAYLILLLVSFVGVGHRYFQMGVLCVWLSWHLFRVARWSNLQRKPFVWAVPFSQLPGMVTVVLSLWGLGKGGTSEWANALLEVWVYPFSPILESVPARTVAGLSLSYLAACALPFLFALMTAWWWRFTHATS